jgi:hypothetical protein
MPSRRRVGSPSVNSDQRRETCGVGVWLGSPHVDRWWWLGRRWPQQAAAARSRRCARCGSGSGEARGGEAQCTAMGARGWYSEGLGGLAGGGSERGSELTGGGGNGRSAGGGLTRGWRGRRLFYSRARRQASLPPSDVTGALRRGVRRPSACVRGGRTNDAVVSARTPRGAQAHRPRQALVVPAGLTHVVLTHGLLGGAVVWWRTAAAQRRCVNAHARDVAPAHSRPRSCKESDAR